jgi:transcription antitermination factor NusA-like protein
MVSSLDMQHMRYINLFEKVTKVSTRFCFKYNETIFFCVPKILVSKSIGDRGDNVRTLSQILNKKIKIIIAPRDIHDAREFIQAIVDPVKFKSIEINDNEIVLGGSTQSKAALIGRNKRRLLEMQKVIGDFFQRDFRVA